MAPFVSVVVPTRNRPELLRYCLESLTLQTFNDFEVIVSDNHTGQPARAVFDQWADGRFKYVTPPEPLAMHDNWEFAASHATGEYVAVLIDKTILRPSALQVMDQTLKTHPAEIVSWWAEAYVPQDEQRSYGPGLFYACQTRPCPAAYFDPKVELARRFRLDVRLGMEGIHYFRGKICFGAYQASLVRRVKERLARIFHPIAPDYTSMVAALAYARSAVDVGEPLLIQFITRLSNGFNVATRPELALRFLNETDPSGHLLQTLPLKGLYSSHHNLVASDYARMQGFIGDSALNLRPSRPNLVLRISEDLKQVMWRDGRERAAHYALYAEGVHELSTLERTLVYPARFLHAVKCLFRRDNLSQAARALRLQRIMPARLRSAVSAMIYRGSGESGSYETIVAAARVADRHYLPPSETRGGSVSRGSAAQ